MSYWQFYDFTCLPVAVAFLFREVISINSEDFDELTLRESAEIYERLKSSEEALEFLDFAIVAVRKKKIETERVYKLPKSLSDKDILNIFVESAGFFRWAEKEGVEFDYFLQSSVKQHEKKLLKKNYSKNKITQQETVLHMKEPLWNLGKAILYLHGYDATEDEEIDLDIVNSDKKLKRIYIYAQDSSKLNRLKIIGVDEHAKVLPHEFMEWAETLDMGFPNLVGNARAQENGTNKLTYESAPYLQLMLDAMLHFKGRLKDRKEKKQTFEEWIYIQGVKKFGSGFSKSKAESMATFIRPPEFERGGNKRIN